MTVAHFWAALLGLTFVISSSAATTQTSTHLIRDLEYARPEGVTLRLDACIPEGAKSVPAVIIVHGGGWVAGDRRYSVEPLFEPLSQAGFAWFSISYRLATNVAQFGVAIDDVQSAIRFVRQHAAEYGIDPNRIALLGESAGGQLAAMAALRAGSQDRVAAVVALYTPSDLVALAKNSDYVPRSIRESVQGTPLEELLLAGLAQLSPVNNVKKDMPPFLLIHGTADKLVPFSQSQQLCARMNASGGSCELVPVQGGGHGIRWWESYPTLAASYKVQMINWLDKILKVTPAPRS